MSTIQNDVLHQGVYSRSLLPDYMYLCLLDIRHEKITLTLIVEVVSCDEKKTIVFSHDASLGCEH